MEPVKRHRKIWTKEENQMLKFLVEEKNIKDWVTISHFFNCRSNKDCRDHYIFHLSPNVVKRKWSIDEELYLVEKYKEFGPKWVKLTAFFDKRSPNDLKNRIKLIQQRKKPLRNKILNLQEKKQNTLQPSIQTSNMIEFAKMNIDFKKFDSNDVFDQNFFFNFSPEIEENRFDINDFLQNIEDENQQITLNFEPLRENEYFEYL